MFSGVESYKELEFQLYGEMIQLRELHKALKNEQEVEQISKIIDTLKTRTFRVAVVGEFKRGKSSLINALLGSVILPADVTPATATINRITYGTTPAITICYHNGTKENIDIKSLPDYVTMLTPEGLQRASAISEAIVYYPTSFCQNHIELIDTPGLSDNDQMTGVTMNLLGGVDAAIVVISALAPFSETEGRFVADLILSEKQTNLVFVVTYIDEVDEDRQDEVVAVIHKRIQESVVQRVEKSPETADKTELVRGLLQSTPIYGVSSKLALKAFISNSSKMLKESRFEPFKAELYKTLTAKQGLHTLNLSVEMILSSCNAYEKAADALLARADEQLNKAAEILKDIRQFNGRSVTAVIETLNKIKAELAEPIKSSCDQMRELFLKLLRDVFVTFQGRTDVSSFEIQKAVSEVSFKCYTLANQQWNPEIKVTVTNSFKRGILDLIGQRQASVTEKVKVLNTCFPVEWQTSGLFSAEPDHVFNSIGYPCFAYQIPVAPMQKKSDLSIYRHTAANAFHISLQTLEKHWEIFSEATMKWWVKSFTEEATTVHENINRVHQELENRKKEREFQAIQINCQKNNIRAIRSRVEVIKHRLQVQPGIPAQ